MLVVRLFFFHLPSLKNDYVFFHDLPSLRIDFTKTFFFHQTVFIMVKPVSELPTYPFIFDIIFYLFNLGGEGHAFYARKNISRA